MLERRVRDRRVDPFPRPGSGVSRLGLHSDDYISDDSRYPTDIEGISVEKSYFDLSRKRDLIDRRFT